jgi:uncharacterized protein (DUF305 family)
MNWMAADLRPWVSVRSVRAAALAVLLAAGACASGGGGTSADVDADVNARFEALYRARAASARMRFTEADVDFMNAMIGHHAQALVMSGFAPTHGASLQIQTLAARIINAQQDEITRMQQWLRDRGRPAPEVMIQGSELMIHGGPEHVLHGPGMLSPAQMAELESARGTEFDRLFLTYMIQHHEGAVAMVEQLFATDGAAQDNEAFKLASDVHVDQVTEIARMQGMLAAINPRSPQ